MSGVPIPPGAHVVTATHANGPKQRWIVSDWRWAVPYRLAERAWDSRPRGPGCDVEAGFELRAEDAHWLQRWRSPLRRGWIKLITVCSDDLRCSSAHFAGATELIARGVDAWESDHQVRWVVDPLRTAAGKHQDMIDTWRSVPTIGTVSRQDVQLIRALARTYGSRTAVGEESHAMVDGVRVDLDRWPWGGSARADRVLQACHFVGVPADVAHTDRVLIFRSGNRGIAIRRDA